MQRQKSVNKQQNGEQQRRRRSEDEPGTRRASPGSSLCVSLLCLSVSLVITWWVSNTTITRSLCFKACLCLSSAGCTSSRARRSQRSPTDTRRVCVKTAAASWSCSTASPRSLRRCVNHASPGYTCAWRVHSGVDGVFVNAHYIIICNKKHIY